MKQAIAGIMIFAVFFPIPAGIVTAEEGRAVFVSPEYIAAQIKSSREILLVDVRKKAEYEQIRIPGAIRIPVDFIKTKTYLKSKNIVLVNKGFSSRPLVSACKDLGNMGFDARILSGGLNAWVAKGLPVRKEPFAQMTLAMVSPRRVFQQYAARSFLPVDISGLQASVAFDNTVYVNPTGKELISVVAGYHKKHPHHSVLIFNQAGTGYATFRKKIKSAEIKNVFFLTGGMKAYVKYLENRERAGAPKKERIKSTRQTPCRSCED